MAHTTITVAAARYIDSDDCLADAAADYAKRHPETEGYDMSPRFADANRDVILLDVPSWTLMSPHGIGVGNIEDLARWLDGIDPCQWQQDMSRRRRTPHETRRSMLHALSTAHDHPAWGSDWNKWLATRGVEIVGEVLARDIAEWP